MNLVVLSILNCFYSSIECFLCITHVTLHVPRTQTSFGDRSFAVAGPRTWNNLPDAIRDSSLSFLTFTKLLKSYLFVCSFDCRGACDF